MAAALSNDKEGHASAVLVVLDIFPQIMREMIANIWQPKMVLQLIKNEKTFLNNATQQQQKMILKLESDGYNVLDISCLYIVIRNFNLLPRPKQGWGKKPNPEDQSEGDDVERMKRHRNDIIHRPKGGLTEPEINIFFQESIEIAKRMDKRIGSPKNGFESKIEEKKSNNFTRQKYIEALEKCAEYQERLLGTSRTPSFDLYYGNDIKVKTDTKELRDNGSTPCTLYVKDPDFDVNAVIQRLEEMIEIFRKREFNISLEDAEIGSLNVHVIIPNRCFVTKEVLHKEIQAFLQHFFQIAEIGCITRNMYTVVLAVSENFVADKKVTKIDDFGYIEENSLPILKLNVNVKNSAFEDELVLSREVGRFITGIYNAVGRTNVPVNGSAREVLMLTSGKNTISSSEDNQDPQLCVSKTKQSDKISSASSSTVDSFPSYIIAKRGELRKSVRELKKKKERQLPMEAATNKGEWPKVVHSSHKQVLFPNKYDRTQGFTTNCRPSYKPLPRISKIRSRGTKTGNISSTLMNISSMTIHNNITKLSLASSNQADQKSFTSRAYDKPFPRQYYRVSSYLRKSNSDNYEKLHDQQESVKKSKMTSYPVLPPIETQEIEPEVQGLVKENTPRSYIPRFTHLPSIEKAHEKSPPLLRYQPSADSGVIDRSKHDIRPFKQDMTSLNFERKISEKHASDRGLEINLFDHRLGNGKYNMPQPDRESDWHYQSKRVSPKTDIRYTSQNKSYQMPVKISGEKTDSRLNSPFSTDKNSQQSYRESRNSDRSLLEITGESMLSYRKTRTPLQEESVEYDIADEQDGNSLIDSEPYLNENYSAPGMRSIAFDLTANQTQQSRSKTCKSLTSGLSRPRSDYIINSVN